MIDIQGNADEYLLTIPPAQKERAKAIPGRRWDPERKVWKFRRTQEAYDALIAEFGDDLSEITITRPGSEVNSTIVNPKWPYSKQSKQGATDVSTKSDSNITKITDYENERENLRKKIQELELKKDPTTVEGFVAFAIASANENEELRSIINQHVIEKSHFDTRLPIVLASALEKHLRRKLDNNDPKLKLHEILGMAKDGDLLSGDYIEFAHIIRKQRNFFAHQDVDKRTEVMRIIFTICAASLLWPHITINS